MSITCIICFSGSGSAALGLRVCGLAPVMRVMLVMLGMLLGAAFHTASCCCLELEKHVKMQGFYCKKPRKTFGFDMRFAWQLAQAVRAWCAQARGPARVRACACVRACVRACAFACVHACARACVRACACARRVCACVRACVRACVGGWVGGWVGGCVGGWVGGWVSAVRESGVCVCVCEPVCVGVCVGGCACVSARACPIVCLCARACVRASGRAVKGTWRNDGKWIENRWKMWKMAGEDVWKMDVCLCASQETCECLCCCCRCCLLSRPCGSCEVEPRDAAAAGCAPAT